MMNLTLTRDQINEFLHTGHIIPAKKGIRGKWMNENAPGWRDGELMAALREAEALEPTTKHFSGFTAAVDEVTVTRRTALSG